MVQSGLHIDHLLAACGVLMALILAGWNPPAHASSSTARASVGVRMMVPQKVTIDALQSAGDDTRLCIGGNARAGRYSIRIHGQPASADASIALPGAQADSCAPTSSRTTGAVLGVSAEHTRHLRGSGAALTLVVVAE